MRFRFSSWADGVRGAFRSGLLFLSMAFPGVAADLGLHLQRDADSAWVETQLQPGQRLQLEYSRDLRQWTEVARTFERLYPYGDWFHRAAETGFYRVQMAPVQVTDDWSNQLNAASPLLFQSGGGSGLAAVSFAKFTILLSQDDRVYFQDSVKYPFHLQFARARLPGYGAIGPVEFNARSLYANAAQQLVLGSILRAPDPQVRELGVEITGAEAFPAAQVVNWLEAVRRRLVVAPGWRTFYLPGTEQQAETEAHRALFAARGWELDSLRRWASANACYSAGWALGRLVFVPAGEISAALADGRLRFEDILVTDHVPAELPVVAGYLCLEPATPNSHVALLARSMLLPFAYANGDGLRAELASRQGHEVLLVTDETNGVCRVSLQDTTGLLSPERRKEILASKAAGALAITPKATRGAMTVSVENVTPADVPYVGGKAANFGFLRRSLPEDSPHPALAITFDLWDAFLAQPVANGQTLREFIQARLSRHAYPPNVLQLRADLSAIQQMIEDGADFSATQRATLIEALQTTGLVGAKIRFRSSTNVEDSESFSGAGLYDSFSGCLEDDTDSDTTGPSRCDASEPKERGVFRALRKVYASFYNENAVLERLRHGINEADAGMAVLVHFSVPDADEMANGVATLAVDRSGTVKRATAQMVSQLGAESVTNPDVNIRPEVVGATYLNDVVAQAELTLKEVSTRVPAGAQVMTWEVDYRTLLARMNSAALAYEAYFPTKTRYELDFEFKRLVPGRVGLKQMRVVPHPVPVPTPTIP